MANNGEVQRIPPERKPISEFPTPSHVVAFYTELVVRTDPAYKANAPVKRGSRYSTMIGAKREVIDQYPDLFFLQETKYGNDDQRVLWHWATDENAHDTYNADVTYVANAVTYPAFTRVYTTRRELYEAQPTLPIGSPLPGIIAVEITSPGQNHTQATGVIDGTSVAIDFVVDSNGSLVSAVITNTGEELIQNGTPITIIGDGQDSSAIAVTQPVGCVLTAQKKEELPDQDPLQHELVKVTRVYETLPGPWIYSTRIDKDGMLVTAKTRRQVADFITDSDEILGDEWVQTWHKQTDDFVAEENVESRPLPGNPIYDTRVEEDGMVTTITKTLIDISTGISNETLSGGVWTKRRIEEIASTTFVKDTQASNKVAWQISEARPLPGNPLVTTRVEEDGMITTITKVLGDTSLIVSSEVIQGGLWIRTHKEEVSDLVAYQVQEVRPIPGNALVDTRIEVDGVPTTITKVLGDTSLITSNEVIQGGLWVKTFKQEVSDLVAYQVQEVRTLPGNPMVEIKIDKDGKPKDVVRTLKDTLTFSPNEIITGGGVWLTTEKDPVSDLVAWEVITAREVPGNPVLSYKVDPDHEIRFQQTILRERTTITPQATESGGNITTVQADEVTDLVANEVTNVKTFLDEAFYSISVVNLIPREFMATIPTKVVSHILAGTASQTVIGFQEFEVSEKQLTKLLYERRVTTIDAPDLPIQHDNQETTEEYGGGVLNVHYVLDVLGNQGIDQGLLVVDSKLTDLGNGMVVKETRVLPETAWPALSGTDLDEVHLLALPFTRQVVDAGAAGGISGQTYTRVNPIDKWRSISIASTVPSDLSSLNRDYATVVNHAFPDTLVDATLDYATATTNGFTVYDFGLSYTLLRGYRGACDGRIYEIYTNGPPSSLPTVTKFFPQSAIRTVQAASVCADSSDSCSGRSFVRVWEFEFPMSLHDNITVINSGYSMTIPATTPTALPPSGTEITVDIQTERWKYGIYISKIINVIMP